MARRKEQTNLEVWINVAARLPWYVALVLAATSYFALHAWASSVETPPKDLAGLGAFAGRQLYRTIAMFLQYLVPGVLVIGAAVSWAKGRRKQQRYDDTQALGTRSALADLSWQEFEELVAEYYRRQGYQVREIGGGGPDGGVDLELGKGSEIFLVQCKQWRALKVGVNVVRELYGVMASRGATGGYIVTSGDFTADAKAFCEGRNISAVDGTRLIAAMRTGLGVAQPAPRPAPAVVAPSCPKCSSAMVKRVAKQGPNAGNSFWGCSRFPKCNGTRPN